MIANNKVSSDMLSSSHICNCLPVTTESYCLTVISSRLTDPSPCWEPPPNFLTRHLLTQKGVQDWARSYYNIHKPRLPMPLPVIQKYCSDQTLNPWLPLEFHCFSSYHCYLLSFAEENKWLCRLTFILFLRFFFLFCSLSNSHAAHVFPLSLWARCKSPGNFFPVIHLQWQQFTQSLKANPEQIYLLPPAAHKRYYTPSDERRHQRNLNTTFCYKWTLRLPTFYLLCAAEFKVYLML